MTAPTPEQQGAITRDMLTVLRSILWYDADTTADLIRGLDAKDGIIHCLGLHLMGTWRYGGLSDAQIAEALDGFARLAGLQET